MKYPIGKRIFTNGGSFLVFAGEQDGNEMVYVERNGSTKGPVPLVSIMARSEWMPVTDNGWFPNAG